MAARLLAVVVVVLIAVAAPQTARCKKCNTLDHKMDAFALFIVEQFGRDVWTNGVSIFPEKDGAFTTSLYPERQAWEGILTVDGNCRIGGVEKIHHKPDSRVVHHSKSPILTAYQAPS